MPDRMSTSGDPTVPAASTTSPRHPADSISLSDAVLDADAVTTSHQHAMHERVGHQIEVGAGQRRREVRVGGAHPLAVGDRQITPAKALLQAAADVGRCPVPQLDRRRQSRLGERMTWRRGPHVQRASDATERRITSVRVLAASKVRQQIVESPARGAGQGPAVVARAMPAHEDHAVDRRASAEATPSRPSHRRPGGASAPRVVSAQSAEVPSRLGHAAGTAIASSGSARRPPTGAHAPHHPPTAARRLRNPPCRPPRR